MGTAIQTGTDVVSFLKKQHQQVKGLFEEVLANSGKERAEAFYKLRRMLAIHETAEEEIVHPAAQKVLADGPEIVRVHLKQENEAKKALTELESLDLDSDAFTMKFRTLKANVIAHAESEESKEFDKLSTELTSTQLESMRKAVQFAESMAPTRPHAGIESAAGNMIAGPFVSMIDRARDALSGKTPKAE